MIDDKDFHRVIENEKAREGMLQVAYMVSDYYRALISQGVPWEVASPLALHFQERLLNPPRTANVVKAVS